MKKLIFAFTLSLSFMCVNAQLTSPRFGTKKNEDNTGRVLNYDYKIINDVAGYDTIKLAPKAWLTIYQVNTIDSCNLVIPVANTAGSRLGDEILIMGKGDGAIQNIHFYQVSPVNYLFAKSAATLTMPNGRGFIRFVFDGLAWWEQYRQSF